MRRCGPISRIRARLRVMRPFKRKCRPACRAASSRTTRRPCTRCLPARASISAAGSGCRTVALTGPFAGNGNDVKYAAQPYNYDFPSGCTEQGANTPNGDPAADAEVNTLAHELEETTTDPDLNAWYDHRGQENADKCAWTFGTTYPAGSGVANMNLGGKDFLIQRNWVKKSLPPRFMF